MDARKYVLLIFAAALAIYSYSCKDNLTGSQNTNVLYTLDSLQLSTTGTGTLNLSNQGVYNSPYNTIRQIEIDFTGETNIDSTMGIAHMIVKVADQSGGSVPFYLDCNGITSINKSYSFDVTITNDINLWYVQFRIQIDKGFSPLRKVITIRNMKVIGIG